MYAYVGSRTTRERNARGEGITVYRLSADQRTLERVQVVGDLVNPSFLALNKRGDRLYSVHGDGHEVSVFRVDRASGLLSFMQQQDCQGRNPVHLALDPNEAFLVVSNHLTHALAVLPVLAEMPGSPGPHRVEQPFAKPHHNPFDPSGRFVVVPDKGLDRVFAFRFEAGRLGPTAQAFAQTRETAGPRHLAFHPRGPYAYVVNELDSTVTAYRFDALSGALEAFQILPSLPDTFTGNSRASEIVIDASGLTLYASNRGLDSIATFRIDPATGRLTFLEVVASQGTTPRFIALSPDGGTLFVLNEDSDSIVSFEVDGATGRLGQAGGRTSCGSPVCMIFLT
jgi:6-phosphogluconolactonase (cycloisomerase 2 family)